MTCEAADPGSDELLGVRILVVDDELVIALDLEQILGGAGAQVVGPACNLADAIDLVLTEPLSAALLDVRVGGQLVTPVAQALADRDIPIVFYSGQIDTDDTLRHWPDATFVAKPAPARQLVSAVRRLVEAPAKNT